jgi:PAS domain S-box-containing protein
MSIDDLRARAEQTLRMTRREVSGLASEDFKALINEVQVHQVELEMQNETLRGAQHELAESQALYQDLFNHAPIGYVTLDERGLITRANVQVGSLLGVASSSLIGKPFAARLAHEHRAEYQRVLDELKPNDQVCTEVRAVNLDGSSRDLQLQASLSSGAAHGWLISLTDVSERKRSHDALESFTRELELGVRERTAELAMRNRELEAEMAARARSEALQRELESRLHDAERFESLGLLAGGIAHDFNNLLVGVMGNVELLRLTPQLPEACQEPLSLIMRASQLASGLTRQLLVFAGKGHLSMTPVNLPKAVAENIELLRTRVPTSVQLQAQGAAVLPDVRGDRSQINQLVVSLVNNAIEAGSGSGDVVVETREQELDAESLEAFQQHNGAQPGRYVILSVHDSGCGMDERTQTRIFDPFYSTKFPGRGLGLATVRGIVHGHRGAIRVRSALGRGTSIDIALPAIEARTDSQRPVKNDTEEWRGTGSILLVDDDHAVRKVVAKLLSVLGFDVTEACSGQDGLDLYRRAQPGFQLVVLDWIMPGLSGKQTLEALRMIAPQLPVILISGYNQDEIGPLDDHIISLQKPMTLTQLSEAAEQLLGRRLQPRLCH